MFLTDFTPFNVLYIFSLSSINLFLYTVFDCVSSNMSKVFLLLIETFASILRTVERMLVDWIGLVDAVITLFSGIKPCSGF